MGSYFTFVMTEDKKWYSWGLNNNGQLMAGRADLEMINPLFSSDIPYDKNIKEIALGAFHCCAIIQNSLFCWGGNEYGQLGIDSRVMHKTKKPVDFGTPLQTSNVVLGSFHTCSVMSDLALYCWGFNGKGQLGIGDFKTMQLPAKVPLGEGESKLDVLLLRLGGFHTCAVMSDAILYCWGYNKYGQLGDDSTRDKNWPTEVKLPKPARLMALGDYHTCVATVD